MAETVNGLGNWRLTIERRDNEIHILRAVTCDRDAVLPDTLFSLPVTHIENRALSPTAKPVPGEQVQIVCGLANGDWDNRNIRSLALPRGLKRLDEYALMNLSDMETLELYDDIELLSFSSLMNCRMLRHIKLTRTMQTQGPVLADIITWYPRELEFTVYETDGGVLKLIFPEYYEIYSENGSTHFFDYIIEGAGFPYHHVCKNRCLSIAEYDGLWKKYIAMDYEPDTALRLAYGRVCSPYGLSIEAERDYRDYLFSHSSAAFELALKRRDMQGLRLLLEAPALTGDMLACALDMARELHFTEATALLLEKQHKMTASGRRRSFEL